VSSDFLTSNQRPATERISQLRVERHAAKLNPTRAKVLSPAMRGPFFARAYISRHLLIDSASGGACPSRRAAIDLEP
jgi:hypothetical protein